jgi:hypothetical protein
MAFVLFLQLYHEKPPETKGGLLFVFPPQTAGEERYGGGKGCAFARITMFYVFHHTAFLP